MWNIYFHLERDRCEIWWYFWFMFSVVRLRFICQIWHIFTSIWAMYLISPGYKLIFDSPWFTTNRLITNSLKLFRFTILTVTDFHVCTWVDELFSFPTFATTSQNELRRGREVQLRWTLEPNWVGSRRTTVQWPLYSCTVVHRRPDPITGSYGRSEFRSTRGGTVRNWVGPVSGRLEPCEESMILCCGVCAAALCQTLNTQAPRWVYCIIVSASRLSHV